MQLQSCVATNHISCSLRLQVLLEAAGVKDATAVNIARAKHCPSQQVQAARAALTKIGIKIVMQWGPEMYPATIEGRYNVNKHTVRWDTTELSHVNLVTCPEHWWPLGDAKSKGGKANAKVRQLGAL